MKHAKVVAKAVIVNKNSKEVLLIRRSKTDVRRPLDWDLVGGTVEDDEDFTAAVVREIEEETGLKLSHDNLHLIWTTSETEVSEVLCRLFYIGYSNESDVKLSSEHDKFIWLPLDEAIETHTYPRHQQILKLVRDKNFLGNS
jgi:8-oxo-dGTP pyrophosphatase MutT (NUDIX family)